eukprot:Gb_29184 [translate_table: standard]
MEATARRRIGSISQHLRPPTTKLSINACLAHGEEHSSSFSRKGPPVIIGGMVVDIHAIPTQNLRPGTTTPGQVKYIRGGVARNIAECMSKLGVNPFIISVVGQDMPGVLLNLSVLTLPGDLLLDHWKSLGLSMDDLYSMYFAQFEPGALGFIRMSKFLWSHLGSWIVTLAVLRIRRCANLATPIVLNIFDSGGELAAAVADVQAVEKFLTPEWINQFRSYIGSAPLLLIDANLHPLALEAACNLAKESNTPVWFEPVSITKSVRVRSILKFVTVLSPNEAELIAMAEAVSSIDYFHSLKTLEKDGKSMKIEAIYELLKPSISVLLEEGVKLIALTLGSHGVLLCFRETCSLMGVPINCSDCNPFANIEEEGQMGGNKLVSSSIHIPILSNKSCAKYQECGQKGLQINCLHFPALPASVVSLTGAGDCFVGGALTAFCAGKDIVNSMAFGVAVAKLAVESELNVPFHFSPNLVAEIEMSNSPLIHTVSASVQFHPCKSSGVLFSISMFRRADYKILQID